MHFDLCVASIIAEYLVPWNYVGINKTFHQIASHVSNINTAMRLDHVRYALCLAKDGMNKTVELKTLLRVLNHWPIPERFYGDCKWKWRDNDYVNYIHNYVHRCYEAIESKNVPLIKFLKNHIALQYNNRLHTSLIQGTTFPYQRLFSNSKLAEKVRTNYRDARIVYVFIRNSKYNLMENVVTYSEPHETDAIIKYYSKCSDLMVNLLSRGYVIPKNSITYPDLRNYSMTHKAVEFFGKRWVIANCPLDVIQANGITHDEVEQDDIIQNRNYPVFKTYYKPGTDPLDLLSDAIRYRNTEAVLVLFNQHQYSRSDLMRFDVSHNAKGIKRLFKMRKCY